MSAKSRCSSNWWLRCAPKTVDTESPLQSSQDENGDDSDDPPPADQEKFFAFFRSTVKKGKEMRLDQFLRYDEVATLLDEEFITAEDVNELWISAVGDASGLDEEEAYEMLTMVKDIPEPLDEDFLSTEFARLTGDKDTLSFVKFINWSDVQDMLNEEALSMEQITELWRQVAGDLNASIDRKQFSRINFLLDSALENDEEEGDEGDDMELDLTGVDIFDPAFEPRDAFDDESIKEITSFYERAAGLKGLRFDDLIEWSDIQDMINEGLITKQEVKSIWQEASKGKDFIDLDTFIRFNIKLDLALEDSTDGDNNENDDEDDDEEQSAEEFYRSEFRTITQGGRLMRLDMLLGWEEVDDLIKEGLLTRSKVTRMWEQLPKEPMGIPSDTFGITEDTFVAFNGMLDLLMDASGVGDNSGAASIPAPLVNAAARPMPSEKELKIGSLVEKKNEGNEDSSSTGLSQSELELMETLDKADNMLNSGSYSDFDRLIGDMNDPRLQALRAEEEMRAVNGDLNTIVSNLLELTREVKRCGLDKPGEEESARIRDLVQAVIEQAPRAAKRDIKELTQACCGKWKLLYTNSEMFDFYNGITGFVNVVRFLFPEVYISITLKVLVPR